VMTVSDEAFVEPTNRVSDICRYALLTAYALARKLIFYDGVGAPSLHEGRRLRQRLNAVGFATPRRGARREASGPPADEWVR
jgi:hypothetical protein